MISTWIKKRSKGIKGKEPARIPHKAVAYMWAAVS
jgi:hypothetical protein